MVWTVDIGNQPLQGLTTALREAAKKEVGDNSQVNAAIEAAVSIAKSGQVGEEPFHVTLVGNVAEGMESPTISVGVSGLTSSEKEQNEALATPIADAAKRLATKGDKKAGQARIRAGKHKLPKERVH